MPLAVYVEHGRVISISGITISILLVLISFAIMIAVRVLANTGGAACLRLTIKKQLRDFQLDLSFRVETAAFLS